jgi:trans-aconitate 2-methyltransferase
MSQDNWDGKLFSDTSQSKVAQKITDSFMIGLNIQGNENILDVGCGDGRMTIRLAGQTDGDVIGVDESYGQIEQAKALLTQKASNLGNIKFEQMSISNIEYSEVFDIVTAVNVMQWIPDHEQPSVLNIIYRSLKPSGYVVVMTSAKGKNTILDRLSEFIQLSPWSDFFCDFEFPHSFYSIDEYRTLLMDAGFVIDEIEVEEEQRTLTKQNLETNLSARFIRWTSQVPPELRPKFVMKFVDFYSQQQQIGLSEQSSPDISYVTSKLRAKARKPDPTTANKT